MYMYYVRTYMYTLASRDVPTQRCKKYRISSTVPSNKRTWYVYIPYRTLILTAQLLTQNPAAPGYWVSIYPCHHCI